MRRHNKGRLNTEYNKNKQRDGCSFTQRNKKKVLYVALRDIKEIIVPVESECLNIIFKSSKI
jgi:hypothetical protein